MFVTYELGIKRNLAAADIRSAPIDYRNKAKTAQLWVYLRSYWGVAIEMSDFLYKLVASTRN